MRVNTIGTSINRNIRLNFISEFNQKLPKLIVFSFSNEDQVRSEQQEIVINLKQLNYTSMYIALRKSMSEGTLVVSHRISFVPEFHAY